MKAGEEMTSKAPMTTANKITIARILLIPVFVGFVIQYASTVNQGSPVEGYRWAAIAVFLIAALSDGLDGYIARRFNQHSQLGVILDPIADKGLLLSGLITLTMSNWPGCFPLWFATLVIGRDALLIVGALVLNHVVGDVTIKPHWTGKVSTFLQMVAISWVMLKIPGETACFAIVLSAGIFTFVSAVVYITDGIGQFQASGHGEADTKLK